MVCLQTNKVKMSRRRGARRVRSDAVDDVHMEDSDEVVGVNEVEVENTGDEGGAESESKSDEEEVEETEEIEEDEEEEDEEEDDEAEEVEGKEQVNEGESTDEDWDSDDDEEEETDKTDTEVLAKEKKSAMMKIIEKKLM